MLTLASKAQMAEVIGQAERLGQGFRLPIYRAVLACRINLTEVTRGGVVPSRALKTSPRPLLIVLGDDDHVPSGPDGWPQARKLLRWAKAVVIHAAGGEAQHYEAIVAITRRSDRCLLIETTSGHLDAWLDLVRARRPALPVLAIKVPPGDPQHPTLQRPPGAVVQ